MIHFLSEGAMRRPGYRYTATGVGYPETARPEITAEYDGPMLRMRDGSLHWLTWRERFLVWIGWEDAMTLEARHRPDLGCVIDWACSLCGDPIGSHAIAGAAGGIVCSECGESEIAAKQMGMSWSAKRDPWPLTRG